MEDMVSDRIKTLRRSERERWV